MQQRYVDIAELRLLWSAGWSVKELAARYCVGETCICALRKKHKLEDRMRPQCSEPPAPSPEDATASEDSLRLSPWVQARINELRIGLPA